ncbi:MAG: hypothetical protein RLY93_08230 [Sumerlaeia bacterium]
MPPPDHPKPPNLFVGVGVVLAGAVVAFVLLGLMIGGVFDVLNLSSGEAPVVLLAVAVMAGLWWWRGARDLQVLREKGFRWATRRDAVRLRNLTGAAAEEIPTAEDLEFRVVSVEELAEAVEERRRSGGDSNF